MIVASIAKDQQSSAEAAASGDVQTNMGIAVRELPEGETCLQALFSTASVSDTSAQSRELKTPRAKLSTYGRPELMGKWVTHAKTANPILARPDELIHQEDVGRESTIATSEIVPTDVDASKGCGADESCSGNQDRRRRNGTSTNVGR